MKVAVAQLASVAGDVEANVATAVEAVARAEGAELLVLPELFLTGYTLPPPVIEADDPRLLPLQDAAVAGGTLVLAGAAIAGRGAPTLSTLAFGGAEVQRVYDKQHLSGGEQDCFAPGESGTVLDLSSAPVGLATCYDTSFPEHGRAAADAGALVYAASIAFFAGSEHRRDLYTRARALDNGFFVAVGALVGECGGAEFCGGAAIHDPEGRTLAAVPDGVAGVAVADLDLGLVATTRGLHPMLSERRELGTVRRSRV
ncbi:carbon-nitrogen hydrolase family protein [Aeromicrobium sp. Leaf350]|uniref:carbon-nitrogen hydrolase family protein n=1 Tax=Aeromicrobium sp. Leaf350 TaxID=2876565 RepID=UPI001E52E8E8|nr:carbon-nitrogen hydrolase family protein [Aeromicrobium sp. Leaf350]